MVNQDKSRLGSYLDPSINLEYSTNGGYDWWLVSPPCGNHCQQTVVDVSIYRASRVPTWRTIIIPLEKLRIAG